MNQYYYSIGYTALGSICGFFLGKFLGRRIAQKTLTIGDAKPNTIVLDTTKKKKQGKLLEFIFGSDNKDMINKEIYENFAEQYSKFKIDQDLTIEINTCGGDLFYSLLIANYLFHHQGKITAIVKNYAMSGGSLIVFSCDKI